ncbi:MBL fold metallo-hydrolase [Streptococcus chenjunshii]|uniref:MBL fold metallo-hydrolase n=1 Tax=Streptococcus chenjunshii TaxID=2173853 RepID=A0A372KJC6_9STRE|nr:MBL fold metallo-hydrolase [Streptococcus chenjunshii]AXQ77894.1 MBL fold metallo-hydrolase [Streptococcus chenjunshii]RFU50196.1 MBL fold metallo-hydrolase [Streptococcus chenjunshii]RFU52375.1 MBL fold metallo-hydrolase [Streptococcus chenjunshii]
MIQELLYGRTRTYLIEGKRKNILIDTDWPGTLPQFFKAIKRAGVTVDTIAYLLITHYHPDHMGLTQDLVDLGIQLVVMDVQMDFIHQSDSIFTKGDYRDFKAIKEEECLFLPCAQSRSFLSDLGISGEIVHTPGHSEDSVSLVLDSGQAVVGDLYPLKQTVLYDNPVLTATWNDLLRRQLTTVYYAHPLPDNVSCWRSVEEFETSQTADDF